MKKFKLSKAMLVASPIVKLESNTECVICRCNLNCNSLTFQDKNLESVVVQNSCGHAFHEECINIWLGKHNYCPLCSQMWTKTIYLKIS